MSEVANASGEPLTLFVIYDHPADFPGFFICRRWHCFAGEDFARAEIIPICAHAKLDVVRAYIQGVAPGVVMLSRCEGDDPAILETWL